jgi:hypothetical protein
MLIKMHWTLPNIEGTTNTNKTNPTNHTTTYADFHTSGVSSLLSLPPTSRGQALWQTSCFGLMLGTCSPLHDRLFSIHAFVHCTLNWSDSRHHRHPPHKDNQ